MTKRIMPTRLVETYEDVQTVIRLLGLDESDVYYLLVEKPGTRAVLFGKRFIDISVLDEGYGCVYDAESKILIANGANLSFTPLRQGAPDGSNLALG